MAAPQEVRDFASRLARTAFVAGERAARLPRGERDRAHTAIQATAQDMLAGYIEAEVERRVAAEGVEQ